MTNTLSRMMLEMILTWKTLIGYLKFPVLELQDPSQQSKKMKATGKLLFSNSLI